MDLTYATWTTGPKIKTPGRSRYRWYPGRRVRRLDSDEVVRGCYLLILQGRILGEIQEVEQYGVVRYAPYLGRAVGIPDNNGGIRHVRFGVFMDLNQAKAALADYLSSMIALETAVEGYD